MFFGDHPPPHVHIQLADGRDCIVAIQSLKIIGKISAREIKDAMVWIEFERLFLLKEWLRCNS
jgi:hypothetical protein